MTENYDKQRHDAAAGTIKAHGIVSIIFGSLGTLISLFYILAIVVFGAMASYESSEIIGATIYAVLVFIFATLPHIFFIVSGTLLVRNPRPKLAKGLIISNLVLSAFWNLVILVLAIINLTQIGDYERGHNK
jgi:hypothetical protein